MCDIGRDSGLGINVVVAVCGAVGTAVVVGFLRGLLLEFLLHSGSEGLNLCKGEINSECW